jgi:hypothetical protein
LTDWTPKKQFPQEILQDCDAIMSSRHPHIAPATFGRNRRGRKPSIGRSWIRRFQEIEGLQGASQDNDSDDEDLQTLHPKSEGLPHLKNARLCRGFKRMYARPCKRDPANRPAPQEQVRPSAMLLFDTNRTFRWRLFEGFLLHHMIHDSGGYCALKHCMVSGY